MANVTLVFPELVNGTAIIVSGRNSEVQNNSLVTGDLVIDGTLIIGNSASLTCSGTCYISGTLNIFPVGFLRCRGLLVLRSSSTLIVQSNQTGRLVPIAFQTIQGVFGNVSAASPQPCANAFLTANTTYVAASNGFPGTVSVPVTVQYQFFCYYGWVTGAVIGIIIGGIALIVLLVLLVLFCRKKNQDKKNAAGGNQVVYAKESRKCCSCCGPKNRNERITGMGPPI